MKAGVIYAPKKMFCYRCQKPRFNGGRSTDVSGRGDRFTWRCRTCGTVVGEVLYTDSGFRPDMDMVEVRRP